MFDETFTEHRGKESEKIILLLRTSYLYVNLSLKDKSVYVYIPFFSDRSGPYGNVRSSATGSKLVSFPFLGICHYKSIQHDKKKRFPLPSIFEEAHACV